MSAIDNTFHFVRNPTAINGLVTTYVSKRGSDTTGDGTAQNPYASIAYATSVATSGTNIMLDDGEWNEARTSNNRVFNWWGNAKTKITSNSNITWTNYGGDNFRFLYLYATTSSSSNNGCIMENCIMKGNFLGYAKPSFFSNSIIIDGFAHYQTNDNNKIDRCILINANSLGGNVYVCRITNSIIIGGNVRCSTNSNYNNFTTSDIQTTGNANSINDASTGQTFADYFNHYDASDWLKCDFTAKEGSANIGKGEKGITIGLNQGYTMYADNSSTDMFKESNGATLRNIEWNSTLGGYVLIQKEKMCQGATSNAITLDSSASSVDDYYNNLFIGIVGGGSYGEFFLITDYDGATKTATIDGTWATTPTTSSVYTISGTILSAVKDFGKAIKVKRNFTFLDNMTALTDGRWGEFLTHVTASSKQFPTSSYQWKYSVDGTYWYEGATADDLVSATNGENKVYNNTYGDCSSSFDEENAKNVIMRYIQVRIHIGFNIGQVGED